jgi:hypothetical protein
MKVLATLLILATAFAVLRIPATSAASEQVGIYAIVERIVLEPDEQNPQRIQLWGAFATDRTTANPKKGYMYFTLPASQQSTALKEWADFKSTAGTGRVVSFAASFFGGNQSNADAYHASLGRVRPASESPQSPDVYTLNFGVYTVSNPTIVQLLKKALKG